MINVNQSTDMRETVNRYVSDRAREGVSECGQVHCVDTHRELNNKKK